MIWYIKRIYRNIKRIEYFKIEGNNMEGRNGVKWSREETILAYELYCRTSFSKISQTNPEIKKLSELLGRTPGSVALKMHNLAHYDPELKKKKCNCNGTWK